MNRILTIALCCFSAGVGGSFAQSQADPHKLAGALKGDTAGPASANKRCQMFTKSEASRFIGEAVIHVENAAFGTGCQWTSASNDGSMLVQIVPARDHERPSRAPGFKKLPDAGTEAFVVPQMGGWRAGSLQGMHSIQVTLSGKGASETKAVELLKESMKRDATTPEK